MREAIRELLEVEEQARKIVQDTEKTADERRRKAQIDADAVLEQARSDASRKASELVAEAVEKTRAEKKERLEALRKEIQAQTSVPSEKERRMIDRVMSRLLGTEDL